MGCSGCSRPPGGLRADPAGWDEQGRVSRGGTRAAAGLPAAPGAGSPSLPVPSGLLPPDPTGPDPLRCTGTGTGRAGGTHGSPGPPGPRPPPPPGPAPRAELPQLSCPPPPPPVQSGGGTGTGTAGLSRSSSLSEKELKEAKARSRRIVAQLTTAPGPSSKGVLLFHRRKQRVDGLTGTGAGHGTGLPLSPAPRQGAMEEGEGHGARGTPPEPADGQQVPLSIYLKENMAPAATNGLHERERAEGEVGKVGGMQDGIGVSVAAPVPPQNVHVPERKNGEVPGAPMGTGSTPMGTASMTTGTGNAPVGTASITMGTGNTPVGTASMTMGTGNAAVEMPSVPMGTANTPMGTANAPMGTASVPMGTANTPMGTANAPMGTASVPMGTASASIGMASASMGMPSAPMGTANAPMGTASVPMGMPSAPMGTANTPMGTASTPMGTASSPMGTATPAGQAQNGARSRQYYEVHLTLAKPKPVKNRTARPFGTQKATTPSQGPSQPPERAPAAAELPPPPTYAETLGSPPPLSRVRSPPAYSALYPPIEQKVLQSPVHGAGAVPPLPKTGILEESAARRAHKKSMFTFIEKPKLGPNPDLLDLVQSADIRKKQKEHGEPGAEDEPFALGAEASNFVPSSTARGGQHLPPADDAPAWSSCLKSPTIQPKPKPQPSHNLTEARGKGAELFARRQSRMEKFIIEAPSQPDLLRSPSPTMSLPPSWKYDANACLSPMVSRHPVKSPCRPSKTPPASLYGSALTENEVSQKELEISKHQPYQLQSSLFILSPSKGPPRSVPREVPPPRPSLPDAYPCPQRTSCPTSPLPPSPVWHPPAVPGAGGAASSPFPSATGALPLPPGSHPAPGAPAELLLASPCRRVKGGFQAPRPSYSTRNAGIEPQDRRPSLPASPTWTPRSARRQGSLDGWASPASVPELDEGPPRSPPWSERSLSPLRQDADPRASRQMQARLARNIINAARRKSSSPKAVGTEGSRPFTPPATSPRAVGSPSLPRSPRPEGCRAPAPQAATSACSMLAAPGSPSPTYKSPLPSPRVDGSRSCASPGVSRATWVEGRRLLLSPGAAGPSPTPKSPLPSPVAGARSPAKRYSSRSPTDSDVSLDSEDSGAKSPGIHSFNLCPRGWTGSLRLKPGGLPSGAPCTS
ncbi:synaptopodin isoform X1 [Anser cygnoides]|uniref:synaptopodin isoform X1 n=1 Tax=Anser cygnoides TaxID=8845 RepID=UPI0034D2C3DB